MEKISETLSQQEWAAAVRRRLGDAVKFSIVTVDWGLSSKEFVGLLGDHFLVKVAVLIDGDENQKLMEFFVKVQPGGSGFRPTFIKNTDAYRKEVGFYSDILEQFAKYGLVPGRHSPVQWCPECYYTRSDVLVFENLLPKGFRMFDGHKYMTVDDIRQVLPALARFHAASIVYEDCEARRTGRECKLDHLYPDYLHEVLFPNSGKSPFKDSFDTGVKSLVALLRKEKLCGVSSEDVDRVCKVFKEQCEKLYEYVKPSDKYRNVVSHADLWPNNMMFRYDEETNKPVGFRLVDFQLIRYAPPALDVMMFLYMVTSRQFREAHLQTLIREYYDLLAAELLPHGVTDFSLEDFLDSCRHYTPAALINMCFYHAIIFVPDSLLFQQFETDECFEKYMLRERDHVVLQCYQQFPQYRDRLRDDMEDFLESIVLPATGRLC